MRVENESRSFAETAAENRAPSGGHQEKAPLAVVDSCARRGYRGAAGGRRHSAPHSGADRSAPAKPREMAVPTVAVVQPKRSAPAQEIVLPANVQAFADAPIYARTNGYLKRWYVDIGSRVKAGPAAGGNRYSGSEPAAAAGLRRPGHGAGQSESFKDHGRPVCRDC